MGSWHASGYSRDEQEYSRYNCGHCGRSIYGKMIFYLESKFIGVVLCPDCEKPTTVISDSDGTVRYPPEPAGDDILGLPEPIAQLYIELRQAYEFVMINSYYMICEKILMSIELDGYKPGRNADACITALKKSPHMTPQLKGLADAVMGAKSGANKNKAMMDFITYLLRSIYEVEHMTKEIVSGPAPYMDPAIFEVVTDQAGPSESMVKLEHVIKKKEEDPSDDGTSQTL